MRARENVLAYASATRGFKSGGFNPTSTEAGRGFAPEWAWSYEGGLKTVVRGGRTQAERGGVLHRLHGPAGADDDPARTDRRSRTPRQATIRGVELEADDAASATPCRPEATWPGWTPATIDTWRSASGASPATWPATGSTTRRNGRAGCGSIGRGRSVASNSLSLRADSTWKTTVFFTPFNDTHPAAGSAWTAGRQRRVRADTPALVGWRVCAQPHERGLHHRLKRVRLCPPSGAGPAILARLASSWRLGGNGRCAAASSSRASWLTWLRVLERRTARGAPRSCPALLRAFAHSIDVVRESFRTELSRQSPEPINFFEVSVQPTPFGRDAA